MIFLQTDLQRTLHEQRCHPSLSRKSYLRSRCIPDTPDSWNSGPLLRDAFWPIRGQCPGHVITLDQSEARISSDLMTASSLWFWQPTNWRACHFYIPGNLNISRIQENLNLLMILYFDIFIQNTDTWSRQGSFLANSLQSRYICLRKAWQEY